ncbi:MAG TPA: hypothetical protein VGG90_00695 [Candidatus Dormibacteraeota bacterium]
MADLEQLDVGSDGFKAVLGHGLAPAGRDRVIELGMSGVPGLQLAVVLDGVLPATDGQGVAPRGRDTMTTPPSPVVIT